MKLLIQHANYVVRDANRVERNIDILIEDSHIVAVGQDIAEQANLGSDELEYLDASRLLVIPGLVNGHTHIYQSLLRGLQDDLTLDDWVAAILFPHMEKIHQTGLGQEAMVVSSQLACSEMLKNGTTSFIDMASTTETAWAEWARIGIRGTVAYNIADQNLPEKFSQSLADVKVNIIKRVEAFQNFKSNSPTFGMMIAPATLLMCSPELLKWAGDLGRRYEIPIHAHVAETKVEYSAFKEMFGVTPVKFMDQMGLLSKDSSLAHCVYVSPEDIALLKRREAAVVHCPKSNMILGSGTAPIPEMLAEGIPVALANDGPASNDLLDMFEEMRTAALLQKVQHGADAIVARDVFKMATENGARALGINAGTIDSGKLADLTLINLDRIHLLPVHDVISLLVYCVKGSDVDTVIVDGKIVVKNGALTNIDESEVIERIHSFSKKLNS